MKSEARMKLIGVARVWLGVLAGEGEWSGKDEHFWLWRSGGLFCCFCREPLVGLYVRWRGAITLCHSVLDVVHCGGRALCLRLEIGLNGVVGIGASLSVRAIFAEPKYYG